MKKYLQIISCDWKYRIISYFLALFLILITLNYTSGLTLYISEVLGKYFVIFSALLDFSILILPIILLDKFRGANWLKANGLGFDSKIPKYLSQSILFTAFPFVSILIILNLTGFVERNVQFELNSFMVLQILIAFIFALQEEILFRGFLLNSLNLKFSATTSLLISSLVFSSIHSINNNFSTIAAFNTFLGGIFFGLIYLKTRSLWFPVFFHYFWNLFQTLFIGSNISGNPSDIKLFSLTSNSKIIEFIIGNDYGFEGSVLCTFILLLYILMFRKNETLNPYNSSYNYYLQFNSDKLLLKNDISRTK